MKYFIRVGAGTGKEFKQEVDAEPLIIPGFEQIQLFIFNDGYEKVNAWNVSEVITGYALVDYLTGITTKDKVIKIATQRMQAKGLQWMLDYIKLYKPVAELPTLKEAKKMKGLDYICPYAIDCEKECILNKTHCIPHKHNSDCDDEIGCVRKDTACILLKDILIKRNKAVTHV